MTQDYKVLSVQSPTPTMMVFTLQTMDVQRPISYQPGQYATISFLRHGRPTPMRCFSIMSSPTEQGILQFGMRIKGYYTRSAARSIKPGDKVTVEGPFGGFIFNRDRDHTAVFLAGGIGIAPFMSMIRYATRLQLPNEIMLLYGVQNEQDAAFADELRYMEQINPHFHVIFAVSAGPTDWLPPEKVVPGRVTPELLERVLGGAYIGHSYFLCGPPGFMQALNTALLAHGVSDHNILSEAFNQASQSHSSWISLPSHIYTLTAVSLLFGSGSALAHDIMVTKPKIAGSSAATGSTGTNGSRQTSIDGELSQLDGTSDGNGGTVQVDANGQVIDTGNGTTQTGNGSTSATGSSSSSGGISSSGSSSSGSSSSGGTRPTTPTPNPTPTPAATKPTVNFSASGTSITAGASLSLSWNVAGTATINCTASGGWSGAKPTSGNQVVSPTSTTTYTLTCTNSAGTTSKSVTVTVAPAPIAPTVSISASSTSITAGGSITISWSASGTAPLTCTASGGWSGSQSTSGSQSFSPSSTTTYTLSCSNSAGSNSRSVTVNVTQPAPPPAPPPPPSTGS